VKEVLIEKVIDKRGNSERTSKKLKENWKDALKKINIGLPQRGGA